MLSKVLETTEGFATLLARVGLLSCVSSFVCLESTVVPIRFPTFLTCVRCVRRVCDHVLSEAGGGSESFSTFLTFVRPLPCVHDHVCPKA